MHTVACGILVDLRAKELVM